MSAHFDQYLSCHEAVRTLADDIRTHQGESEQLLDGMKALKQVTDSTLSVMLQRAKEQRRIRNTISVLSRFRPVFEITTKMKESMASKNYEKLAEDYCRLKYHSAKSNISALQQVFTAAHEIAQAANTELLQHFDDISLSVAEQKRAISVLNTLGFVEKPTLICLGKQIEFLERKLAGLSSQVDPTAVVKECASVVYRFRSGLWSFICEVFKTPSGSTVSSGSGGVTSLEAESIQEKAWHILSTCAQLMQKSASPPTGPVLRQLNESFRQLNSLKKCPNASTLNANIAELKDSFCEKFRVEVVLEFIAQVSEANRDRMMQGYFDPIVMSLPSFATESSIDLTAASDDRGAFAFSPFATSDVSGLPLTKVGQLVTEATGVFDEIRNTSMVSSESKINLNRASVLTSCSTDIMRGWEAVWRQIGPVLLELLDNGDAVAPGTSGGGASSGLQVVVIKAFKAHLYDMLSLFLEKLLRSFVTELSPPTTMASVAGSTKNRSGAEACVLFAIVSNCIELREKGIDSVEKWISQLNSQTPNSSSSSGERATELRQLVQETESKCVEMYVSMHTGPLLQVLKSGAAEEPQQTRSSSSASGSNASSRTASLSNSRTNSFTGGDSPATPSTPLAASSLAAAASASIPNDGRQYVFNVLLQLITLRSEVETSLANCAQCAEYVRAVTFQLTSVLGRFLQDSVRELEASREPSEWLRIHVSLNYWLLLRVARVCLSNDLLFVVARGDTLLPVRLERRDGRSHKDPAHRAGEDAAAGEGKRESGTGAGRAAEPDEAPDEAVPARACSPLTLLVREISFSFDTSGSNANALTLSCVHLLFICSSEIILLTVFSINLWRRALAITQVGQAVRHC